MRFRANKRRTKPIRRTSCLAALTQGLLEEMDRLAEVGYDVQKWTPLSAEQLSVQPRNHHEASQTSESRIARRSRGRRDPGRAVTRLVQ